tara:strand:+ start:108 stop:365 length:258 start_codon:yes stop_codon:yes gene_type:complete
MKKGDKVKLTNLISEDHEDWKMSKEEFGHVKRLVNKIGTIFHVQKHYGDDGRISYFIDVSYASGYKLRRVNKLAFELVEFDFDYI